MVVVRIVVVVVVVCVAVVVYSVVLCHSLGRSGCSCHDVVVVVICECVKWCITVDGVLMVVSAVVVVAVVVMMFW